MVTLLSIPRYLNHDIHARQTSETYAQILLCTPRTSISLSIPQRAYILVNTDRDVFAVNLGLLRFVALDPRMPKLWAASRVERDRRWLQLKVDLEGVFVRIEETQACLPSVV
jgi:hypothetical protein